MAYERHEHGRLAEDAAAAALRMLGFQIEGRNVRIGHLEADIVAGDCEGKAIVEVRSREAGEPVGAFESLSASKQQRIERAAALLGRGGACRIIYVGVALAAGAPAEITVLDAG